MTLCILNLTSPPPPPPPMEKMDPGSRGLHNCCGYADDGVNGSLELCTESLGFESGDGRVGEGEAELDVSSGDDTAAGEERTGRRRGDERRKEFPPPLRWIGEGAHMKAERRDGRLILTEVWTERPDIFYVSREDGRLKLHLIGSEEEEEEEEEEVTDEESGGGGGSWDWGRDERRREGIWRCQEAVSGNGMPLLWSNHRFLTTA